MIPHRSIDKEIFRNEKAFEDGDSFNEFEGALDVLDDFEQIK